MKFKFDWFMKGMLGAVLLAFLWPEPGAKGGFLQPELLNKLGVALVFYLNGLALSLASMKDGALRWKVHLLIQACTFLISPALGWLLLKTSGGKGLHVVVPIKRLLPRTKVSCAAGRSTSSTVIAAQ